MSTSICEFLLKLLYLLPVSNVVLDSIIFIFLIIYSQIGELYDNDPLALELATEFWCPLDPSSFTPHGTLSPPALRQRASQKQVRAVIKGGDP